MQDGLAGLRSTQGQDKVLADRLPFQKVRGVDVNFRVLVEEPVALFPIGAVLAPAEPQVVAVGS